MRSGVITAIILLVSVTVLFLGYRTDIKPQRHLRGYLAGLLLVSIPSVIWLIWHKNMGNINLDGPILGLNLNVILSLLLLPYAGLYLWGIVKKFIGNRQLSILLPVLGIGLFAGFSLILLINGATGFTRFAAMSALIASIVLFFTKLLFTSRFWSYQVVLIAIWLLVSLIFSVFGHNILGKTFSINTLLVLLAFMNVFLAVFDWFDNTKTYLAEEVPNHKSDKIGHSSDTAKVATTDFATTNKFSLESSSNNKFTSERAHGMGSLSKQKDYISENKPEASVNLDQGNLANYDITQPHLNTVTNANTQVKIPSAANQENSTPIKQAYTYDTSKDHQAPKPFAAKSQLSTENSQSHHPKKTIQYGLVDSKNFKGDVRMEKPSEKDKKLNEKKETNNSSNIKHSKFRMPKVNIIPRLLKFSSKSDIDHLTKENNDFKMPVFGAARKSAELHQREIEPEFSVNLRTGETISKNGSEVTDSRNLNYKKSLPTINSNLTMPRANFAIKKTKNINHLKSKKTNSNNIKPTNSLKSTTWAISRNDKLKTPQDPTMTMPNFGSRVTNSLLLGSQNKPRQKRPVRVENISKTKISTLNIDALSKVVGKYNNSNVGKYIKKTNLAIPYRSQETLDKIVAYKNSLLKRMTFRNTKQIEYIGQSQDNLLIDRLHRTTRMLSANKQSTQY